MLILTSGHEAKAINCVITFPRLPSQLPGYFEKKAEYPGYKISVRKRSNKVAPPALIKKIV